MCCASLAGGKSARRQQSVSLQCLPPPHSRLASAFRMRNQLYRLCHGEGIFHGLPCLATDDSLACVLVTADFAHGTSKYSECQSPKRQGRLYPCQESEATFDWLSRATHRLSSVVALFWFVFGFVFGVLGLAVFGRCFRVFSHQYAVFPILLR